MTHRLPLIGTLLAPRMVKAGFWLLALLVLALSLMPQPERLPDTGWDKSNHLLAFAALALLGSYAYPALRWGLVGGLIAYGGLIELLQSMTPDRTAEWLDWIADGAGIVLGRAAWYWISAAIRKRAVTRL